MPKPCLGYPSRTKAAVALHEKGHTQEEIADMMGIPKGNVAALLASARRWREKRSSVSIRKATGDKLLREAEARGITVNELAAKIIDAVARDDLVNAVLDDERRAA